MSDRATEHLREAEVRGQMSRTPALRRNEQRRAIGQAAAVPRFVASGVLLSTGLADTSGKFCFAAALVPQQAVFGQLVVVAGLRHEPVARNAQSRGRIERAGGDADHFLARGVPEQARAALGAQASPCLGVAARTPDAAKAASVEQREVISMRRPL